MMDAIPAWQDGQLTPIEKLDVHRRGLRHKAISVFVMRGHETLLQQRALGKYHTPGLWANSCCTHPHWQESPGECASRRLFEELGITGLSLHYREQVEYRADVGSGLIEHEVVDIFTAFAPFQLKLQPNPEEVLSVRWVPLPVLRREIAANPERFTPWLRIYLETHSRAIFGEVGVGEAVRPL
ncbi:MAG: isopentenyl-diphosphate delta-isomerase [Pseudomonadota bacterium]